MAQTLIQVKDLKKYYNGGDVKALDSVTVDVYKGDVIAVIGPSGGGKSTFLRLLCGAGEKEACRRAENGAGTGRSAGQAGAGGQPELRKDNAVQRAHRRARICRQLAGRDG